MSRENLVVGEGVQIADDADIGANVVVHAGTVIGPGCVIQDNVVLGKTPRLARRSTAKAKELPGLVLGAGVTVCSGAVIFAGTSVGAGTVIGDQDLGDHASELYLPSLDELPCHRSRGLTFGLCDLP